MIKFDNDYSDSKNYKKLSQDTENVWHFEDGEFDSVYLDDIECNVCLIYNIDDDSFTCWVNEMDYEMFYHKHIDYTTAIDIYKKLLSIFSTLSKND